MVQILGDDADRRKLADRSSGLEKHVFDLAAKIRGLTGFALDGQVLADFDREPALAVNRNARIREQDVDLGERIAGVMERLNVDDETPIENRIISKSLEGAQKKVEGHNLDRKSVV